MISTCRILATTVMLTTGLTADVTQPSAAGPALTRVLSAMDAIDSLQGLKGNWAAVAEGPGGEKALRFEAMPDKEGFSGRIDLKSMGVNPLDYDLLKVEVKADNCTSLGFSLENYPQPGDVSNWSVLDAMNRGSDWRTVWLDLKRPGSMERPPQLAPEASGLRIGGGAPALPWRMQGDSHRIWIKNLRFAKRAISLECDPTQSSYEWGPTRGRWTA